MRDKRLGGGKNVVVGGVVLGLIMVVKGEGKG